jgi:flagellar basal-body rod modification protein FlgD
MSDKPTQVDAFTRLGMAVQKPALKDRNALGQDEFFKLMVAQLNHQDPLKPLESDEFLSQVAQFSTVNGIQSIERSMSDLAVAMESNQALQASTLVGRDVLVPGNRAALSSGSPVSGAVELPVSTGELILDVMTPAGELVRRMELGAQGSGMVQFSWEGMRDDGAAAPEGYYVLEARAEVDGQPQSVPVLVGARVDSVTINRNPPATLLNLEGLGPVNVNDVREFI